MLQEQFLEKADLFPAGVPLLAVSGGLDSMVLLHLFLLWKTKKPGREFAVFHLDHKIREDSPLDAMLIQNVCRRNGIPFYLVRRSVIDFSRRTGLSVEEAGRHLRYRSMGRVLGQGLANYAVTAHHADDFLESLLIHLIRGGGESSFYTLPFIKVFNGTVLIRPLVFFSRLQLEEFCLLRQIPFREDSTNAEDEYLRNRIRHRITPLLKKEGLSTTELYRNFHNDPERSPWKKAILHHSQFVRLERSLFWNAGRLEWKRLLDEALRALGMLPVSRKILHEVMRQIHSQEFLAETFKLSVSLTHAHLWASTAGPVWVIRTHNELQKSPLIQEEDGVMEVRYNRQVRRYRLVSDLAMGLPTHDHWVFVGGHGSSRSGKKSILKLMQEKRIPPFFRSKIPIVYSRNSLHVKRLCLSFIDGMEDLFFS